MTTGPSRPSHAKDPTRSRLLDAAKRVFAHNGFHATRISDIVQSAGVAQGTFYLHFDCKEEAFRQLVEGFYANVVDQALSVAPSEALPDAYEAVEAVRAVWLEALRAFRDDRALAQVILREAQGMSPDVSDVIQRYYRRAVDALVASVNRSALRDLVRDVDLDLVGWAVVGMFERVAYQKVVLEERDDVERIADELLALELHGLLRKDARDPLTGPGA